MFDSLKRATSAYSKSPFPFAWGSLLYVVLFFVFLFAVLGIFLIYFIAMSVLNQEIGLTSIPTLVIFALMAFLFTILSCGLNAALAKTYRGALWKERMSLTTFFSYALDKAFPAFAVTLIAALVWLIFSGPVIVIFALYFINMDYVDIITAIYVLAVTFVVSFAFTPALIYVGLGSDIFGAFRRSINIFRRKHINFFGLYILFWITFVLDFIPLFGLLSIFCAYPVIYSAMISMLEGGVKIDTHEEEN